VFFQAAYNQGWHAPLSAAHAGYLQTFPRVVSDVGLLLPLRQVPLLFAGVALAVQVLPAVLVTSRRFATAVPDVWLRVLLAAVYLAVPNSSEVNVNLTDAQWHLALLAVLVVLATPASGPWRLFDLAAIVLSGLSGPFGPSVIVVAAIVYYKRRHGWTLVLGVVAAGTGAIQVAELLVAQRPNVGPLGITATRFIEVLGGRLVGNTVLGTATVDSKLFLSHILVFSSLLLTGSLAVVGMAVWRGPFELKLFNLWAGLVLIGSLASPLASTQESQWQALIVYGSGARYWLLPSLAILVDMVWLAGQIRSPMRIAAVGASLLLVVVVGFGVREDFRYPTIVVQSWPAQVRQFDQMPPGKTYTFQIRPRGWSMTLKKR
jgi:hypothetical protein